MTGAQVLLVEEVNGRTNGSAGSDVERGNSDLRVAEHHPGLNLASTGHRGELGRRTVGGGQVGGDGVRRRQLEAQGGATLDARVGHEPDVGRLRRVDVDDDRRLVGLGRGVPAVQPVTALIFPQFKLYKRNVSD